MKPKRLIVICPKGVETGGPEALHQLVDACRLQGYDARLCYLSMQKCDSPVLAYSHYRFSTIDFAEIEPTDHLLVAEVCADLFLKVAPEVKKHLWWLSWDNFNGDIEKLKAIEGITHLVQSNYAKKKLEMNELGSSYLLGDYLNYHFFNESKKSAQRKPIVLFSPAKGLFWTNHLRKRLPDVHWVELTNKTARQLRDLMQEASVYIDFGHAPGLDRIPREALISSLAVITSQTGAFGIEEDWNIPKKFKFKLSKVLQKELFREITDEETLELEQAATLIRDILKDREAFIGSYERAVEKIRDEKKVFFHQVKIFCQNEDIDLLPWYSDFIDYFRTCFRSLIAQVHPLKWKKKLKYIETNLRHLIKKKR